MMIQDHWLLWQLADSAFPAGSFGHSGGLEAAWQLGEIPNRAAFENYLVSTLQQLSHAALPFVLEAHRAPGQFPGLDLVCDAFLSNQVANRASRATGKAFLAAASQSFASNSMRSLRDQNSPFHFAPVFGVAARLLEVDLESAVRLFIFIQLRGVMAAAVRLGVIGPLEAQRLQFKLAPMAEQAAKIAMPLTIDDLAHTAPLLDIWQGAHDRLYSRLFQT